MENAEQKLKLCRDEINAIDDELIKLFIKRMETAGKIGAIKKAAGLPVLNVKREEEVKARLLEKIDEKYKESVDCLYDSIFKISREYQEKKA